MSIDFDLSLFRLVKSFAAVEISKNVGVFGPDDVVREPLGESVRGGDATVSAPLVRPGLVAAGNSVPPAVDQIPDSLDDSMRAALDQRLEGPEREAVSWQYGQRSAALSLAALARPGSSPESRESSGGASSQMALQEPEAAGAGADRASILSQKPGAAQERIGLTSAASETGEQSQQSMLAEAVLTAKTVALSTKTAAAMLTTATAVQQSMLTVSASDATPDRDAVAHAGRGADRADARPAGAGIEKPPLLQASSVSLFGEALVADVLQSMVDGRRQDQRAVAATDLESGDTGQVSPDAAEEPVVPNAATRDLMRLSRTAVANTALVGEQAEVPDRRLGNEALQGDLEGAAAKSPAQAEVASRPVVTTALSSEPLDALSRPLFAAHEPQAVSEGGAAQPQSSEKATAADAAQSIPAGAEASGKVATAVANTKVLEFLNALVALSPQADAGSADWQSLSAVILNAAMIPGWPPPRPLENVAVKQADPLAQQILSTEPEEAPMTPEQLLAYLVSIGANLRLLRALQELVARVEKKNGPALLAWLTGLVSALKLIEKSLKDLIEDGLELPEWLAELADAAKRPRRRKQFHI